MVSASGKDPGGTGVRLLLGEGKKRGVFAGGMDAPRPRLALHSFCRKSKVV